MAGFHHRKFMALGLSKPHAKALAQAANEESDGDVAVARAVAMTQAREQPAVPKRLLKLAADAGADPDEALIMLGADVEPELRTLWLSSLADDEAASTLAADDEDRQRARIMAQPDVDPELRRMFLAQHLDATGPPPPSSSAPLAMDDDRYQLHQQAKQLAQTRCDANPRLDAGEAYALAAIELEDRRADPSPI